MHIFTKSLRGHKIKFFYEKHGAKDLYAPTWGEMLNINFLIGLRRGFSF